MTNDQIEILRHALGLDRSRRSTRNYFVTGPGSTDYPICQSLVDAGLMQCRCGNAITGGDPVFFVTDDGRRALAETPRKEAAR